METLEKFIAWFIDTPIHAQQREYLREQTRRLKLKTDIQESRLKAMKKRKKSKQEMNEREHLVALWACSFKNVNSGKGYSIMCELKQAKTHRATSFKYPKIKDNGATDISMHTSGINYAKSTKTWLAVVQPWLNGTISLEQLKNSKHITDESAFTFIDGNLS